MEINIPMYGSLKYNMEITIFNNLTELGCGHIQKEESA